MPLASRQHVSSIEVQVDGAALDPALRGNLLEVRVKDNLALPGTAQVRIADPGLDKVDSHPLQLGKELEVKAGAIGDNAPATVFKGEIVAIEPEFNEQGCVISVRALEYSHRLRGSRSSRTFQQMNAADMFRKVINENGLQVGTVSSPSVVHKHFHQAAEVDWEFLQRLAVDNDCEIVAEGKRIHFRTAGVGAGSPVRLAYGENLLAFRPRMSQVQQPKEVAVRGWDPVNKQEVVGTARNGTAHAAIGKGLRQVVQSNAGNAQVTLSDRTVESQGDANRLAKSHLDRLADSYVEAEGTALGAPSVKAGSKVKIEGAGRTFSGTYVVTSALHVYKGGSGYRTHFTISGRSPRTLLDLMRAPETRDWGNSFAVGVVTNNNDPDQMGRVKVKLPALGSDHESHWARVLTHSAGAGGRGIFMLPQVGEEVVVGFENGDGQRPYVLGSVFNGRDKPGTDLLQSRDGSLAVKSDKKVWVKALDDIKITSDKNMVVEISKDVTEKEGGNYTNEASGNSKVKAGGQITIEAGGTLNIKGASVTVEASGSLSLKGATVSLQGSGPVQIKGSPISIG
jgi:phage protein D/phage baseplate assembly protein gpV